MYAGMAFINGLHVHCYPPVFFLVTAAAFVTGGRIVFAVTQYDSCYTEFDDEEPTLSETKHHVKKGLMSLEPKFDVSLDDIVPVSGKWALLARQLLANPQNTTHLKNSQRCLTRYMERQPHGEGEENIQKQVSDMDAQNIARELERASNISFLEERLVIWLQCILLYTSFLYGITMLCY